MRLAILSDIHGNLAALETVLADLRSCAPDAIVNLGDCVTSPLWPRETLELLETLRRPTVRGNHDRWVAEMPPERVTRTVTFTHDALTAAQRAALGAELARRLGSVTAGLVLCSHSHFPCVALAPGDRLVVNPGSIGCPRYADNADPFASEINSPQDRKSVV